MDHGTYQDLDGRPTIRFERVYLHPIERLWSAITEPDELAHWFPSRLTIEQRTGGAVAFSGDPNLSSSVGIVLTWDPPRQLAFSWGADELHFALEPVGSVSCRLTLTNVLEQRDTAARNASGWEVCLSELDKLLAGTPGQGPHSPTTLPFQPIYDSYVAAGMPYGAPIPDTSDGSS